MHAWHRMVRRADYAVDFMQEVRFVAADDIALSNAHGHAVAAIGAYQANASTAPAYFRDFQSRWPTSKDAPLGQDLPLSRSRLLCSTPWG